MANTNLQELAQQAYGKSLEEVDDYKIYKLLLGLTRDASAELPVNQGKRKLYYISAEFLIGKLLINNLIDLGLYDDIKAQLEASGHDLN